MADSMSESESIDANSPENVAGIIDHLEVIKQRTGHGLPRIFRVWVDASLLLMQAEEEEYVKAVSNIVHDIDDEEEIKTVVPELSKALNKLITVTVDRQQPVIGDIYEQIGASSKEFGQYFTPWSLCLLMAKMDQESSGIDSDDYTTDNPLTCHDPACGSGRGLIAFSKTVFDENPDVPVVVSGVDKSPLCAKMAVLNLVLAGQSGWIIHGNSLTMEHHTKWVVDFSRQTASITRVDDPE